MAKFTKTYELHIGDHVLFRTTTDVFEKPQQGIVQCISEFPDVFVEVGDPRMKDYNRYRISVNLIDEVLFSDYNWITQEVEFEKNEAVEFVYSDDLKKRIFTYKK